jgi:lipopolysaccharide biosynthesis glycosyltransferase
MTSKDDKTIHVALAVHDPRGTYSQHAGVVMASIFGNTTGPVRVHILHDETLTEQNRCFLTETAETFSQKVNFHDISTYVGQLEDEILKGCGTLFRLIIPDILPLDKVIYMDCDIVVNMDIQELWNISVEGYSFAGALDGKINSRFSRAALRKRRIGCDRRLYVNAGVLLMNLSKIREKYQLIQQYALWMKRYRGYARMLDQDFINSCFQNDIKILEKRFNNCSAHHHSDSNYDLNSPDIAHSILHAIVGSKPWVSLRGSAMDRLYWKSFLRTPWGRLSADELVDMMIDIVQKSPLTHRQTPQCYRKIFGGLYDDVVCNKIVAVIGFLLKDLNIRMRRSFAGTK